MHTLHPATLMQVKKLELQRKYAACLQISRCELCLELPPLLEEQSWGVVVGMREIAVISSLWVHFSI